MPPPAAVREVELRRASLPLLRPFRTSQGVERDRDLLFVRVRTGAGEGWGECGALAAPHYTSEYVDGAHAVLRDHLVPLLFAAGDVRAADLGSVLAPVQGHRMAKSALELAVLDLELRLDGRPLAERLGGTRSRVESGVAVGIAGSVEALVDEIESYLGSGYRRVKLKIRPGWDREPVAAVRARFGDGLLLQVDANGAYDDADPEDLRALDAFDLLCLEQPFGPGRLLETAQLAKRLRTPICLDESITSLDDARLALHLGACRVICLKAPRVGGYLEAARIHDLCRARGVPVWCGGMLESGLGRAANLALAALPGFTLPGDLSGSDRYYARDLLTEPLRAEAGTLAVPTGPGIGVELDRRWLAARTTSRERLLQTG